MSYVEVKNLNKSFHDLHVLNNINFSIEKGEFLTLLGPSGCGKSTLLKVIAGLEGFDNGSIIVDKEDISTKKTKDRNVGMVFQSYALFPNMNVYDNIAFGLKMKKMGKDEIDKKVNDIVKIVDLGGKEKNRITALSGGQQQRVALARSIVPEPKILLLDEPLSALDAKIRKSLQRDIRNIQRNLNMTTIFVTHDQEEAMTMSDRIIVMNKGVIAQMGTPDQIYKHPADKFVATFIGSYNVLTAAEATQVFGTVINHEVAVRPEVINIVAGETKNNDYYYLKVNVKDAYMMGSLLRIECYKDNVKLHIDVLNNAVNVSPTQTVTVQIHKKDVLKI
ncbi:MAG: ABC transporter ATP-binding protein, partial [Epulopiscium sp. Nele67-Bin004]